MENTLLKQIETINHIEFTDLTNIPVSNLSGFHDSVWDFTEEDNERYVGIEDSKLRINWEEWQKYFGQAFIHDIKVLSFAKFKFPSIFKSNNHTAKSGYKPNTILEGIKSLLRFFRDVKHESGMKYGENSEFCYDELNDVILLEIEDYIEENNVPNGRAIKSLLIDMFNPSLKKMMVSLPNWKVEELKRLDFIQIHNQRKIVGPISDDYFLLLTNTATNDVLTFLHELGHSVETETHNFKINNDLIPTKGDFTSCFEEYRKFRLKNKGHRIQKVFTQKKFVDSFGFKVGDMHEIIVRIQRAAIYLVLQFTGVRFSEGASFTIDCLVRTNEIALLKGTVIKFQNARNLNLKDEWVATPIVIDAVNALIQISTITNNKYLLSSFETVRPNSEGMPYTNGGINEALNLYVKNIDREGKYSSEQSNQLTVHRLRHTLVKQFVKAKLNLPYISHHLKHVHQGINQYHKVNNVTLGYGNIGNELFNDVLTIEETRREVISNIYHPDSTIMGGRGEELKKRRKHFFEGMMETGWSEDEILDYIATSSVPLINVGLGYCGKDEVNDQDQSLPCIGQLQCNPANCPNAIIPSNYREKWEKIYEHNTALLNNQELQHFRSHYEKAAVEAKSVLDHLDKIEH